MKKIYLLMVVACMSATHIHAQNSASDSDSQGNGSTRDKLSLGIKVGANYSNIYDTNDESIEANSKFGLATGVFVSIPIGEVLGVQPEILFSQKGYKAEGTLLGSPYEITRTSNYIDVPLLVAVKPSENLTILAGPQYSFLMSQNNKFENGEVSVEQEEEFDNENLRKNTLCFTGGLDMNLGQLVIGSRVGWDLFKNNGDGSTTTPRYKNVWYQLTLGIRL